MNALFSIASLMLDFNKIRIKFTEHNSSRQKLTNIFTVIERRVLNTMRHIENKLQSNKTRVNQLHIKCPMLLINCDTIGDKRFIKSVGTDLLELMSLEAPAESVGTVVVHSWRHTQTLSLAHI